VKCKRYVAIIERWYVTNSELVWNGRNKFWSDLRDYPDIHLKEFRLGTSWKSSGSGIHCSVSMLSISNSQKKDLEEQAQRNLENITLQSPFNKMLL
jgi:hypothetical protein